MPFIILDRDGVINYDSDKYIKSPDEWLPIPGSLAAIAQLNRAGFTVFVATNQSGVARGHYDLETLHAIHEKFLSELKKSGGEIKEIFYCPHHPRENCTCRKPQPGLIQQIQEKYAVDLAQTFFIGDSYTDMQVAKTMGCKPLLVLTGNGQQTLVEYPECESIPYFADLAQAVEYVLTKEKQ